MFHKSNRLAKTKDVKRALGRGRAFFNGFFILKFVSAPNAVKRFTVIVSTKVSKKAVLRNRIKRVVREYIRLRMDKFTPGDYALIVKPALAKTQSKEWREKLRQLFLSARVLR